MNSQILKSSPPPAATATPPPANRQGYRRRWFIVAVIFFGIVFNYVDRQIVSILKPEIKESFGLDDSGFAVILNVFTVCYAIMYPVTGWLVDKVGPRLVMLVGVITWSIACIGGGISRSVGAFGFFRGLLGLAEPTNFPAQVKVVTIWFPGQMRATANSLCVAGSSIGAIIAPPAIAYLAQTHGWHSAFIVPGVIGLVIAAAWGVIYRDPPRHVQEEVAASDATVVDAPAFTWPQLWRTRSLWGILLIRFVSDPVWYFCLFWLPGYLREESGLSLTAIGLFGWIPFLAADLGGIGTSAWSDWMVRRGVQPLRARKIMLISVAGFGLCCALTPFLHNAYATIAIFSVVAAVCISWLFSLSVVIAETFPAKNVASVLGIAGGFGAAGAVLFNTYVGEYIGKSPGEGGISADRLFFIMAFLHPLAALLLATVVRPENPNKLMTVAE